MLLIRQGDPDSLKIDLAKNSLKSSTDAAKLPEFECQIMGFGSLRAGNFLLKLQTIARNTTEDE